MYLAVSTTKCKFKGSKVGLRFHPNPIVFSMVRPNMRSSALIRSESSPHSSGAHR